ncbi:MAG: hypothetical protein WC862_03955 [Patescibacteria group bacterium]
MRKTIISFLAVLFALAPVSPALTREQSFQPLSTFQSVNFNDFATNLDGVKSYTRVAHNIKFIII